MAYKRKSPYSRRRKPFAKRARMMRRVPRSLKLNTVTFKRKFWYANWQPSTTTTADFWKYWTVNLAAVPQYAEITSLFDEYRINALKFEFHPRFDSFAGDNTTDTTLPGITNQSGTKLHILVDPSSTLTPSGTYVSSTLNVLMENGNVRTHSGNRIVSVYYKPKFYDTVGGVAGRMSSPKYLRTDSSAIQHLGFHSFAQDNNFNGTFGQSWDVFVTAYISARNMK